MICLPLLVLLSKSSKLRTRVAINKINGKIIKATNPLRSGENNGNAVEIIAKKMRYTPRSTGKRFANRNIKIFATVYKIDRA